MDGDGDCVFPTQATFSCKCLQESFYLPGKGDLGTKIKLPCSQRAPAEVSIWPEPVSDPCRKEGMPGGFLLSQHGLILQEVWLLTAGFHFGFSCLLEVQPPSFQVLPTNYYWSPLMNRWVPWIWHLLCAELFLWMGPFWAFPEKTQGRQRGFLFPVEKYRYPLLTSTWLTSSRGLRAVSKLSSLLGTPVIDTPCHRGNKRKCSWLHFPIPRNFKHFCLIFSSVHEQNNIRF